MDFLPSLARYPRIDMSNLLQSCRRRLRRTLLAAACAVGLGWMAPAQAQLGLPRLGLPLLPRELTRVPSAPLPDLLQGNVPLQALRLSTVRDLLRNHGDALEADPAGEPVRRQELLLVSPTPATIDAALAIGFALVRDQDLPALGLRQVVLRAPSGAATAEALARLRALDPQLELDFNHIYTRSGEASVAAAAPTRTTTPTPTARRCLTCCKATCRCRRCVCPLCRTCCATTAMRWRPTRPANRCAGKSCC